MITRGNSFKLLLYYIFLEDTNLTILTRQEKERLVLELYNLGKTYREISKEARISPRDIGVILNKVIEDKTERLKEEQSDAENNQEHPHLSLSTRAYKLFSEGKTSLEVAIALNLSESEATEFCREYWKLKQLYNLNTVYEDLKGDIDPFLKLYKLAKRKGIGVRQVVDALNIANNDLPAIEERFNRLRNDVSMLQFQKHTCKRNLYQLNNQIASTTRLLSSFRISCERQRREMEHLQNEKARLEDIVTQFKNNNEEYLDKIKQVAYEEVKSVLNDSKLLLKVATLSIIEALRRNSELYNFVLYDTSVVTTSTAYGSNYLSLMSGRDQHHQRSFNDTYIALILKESEKLYNELIIELTDTVMAAAADATAIRASSLSTANNRQKLIHKIDKNDEIEKPRYNN
jgi:hypothetical protein